MTDASGWAEFVLLRRARKAPAPGRSVLGMPGFSPVTLLKNCLNISALIYGIDLYQISLALTPGPANGNILSNTRKAIGPEVAWLGNRVMTELYGNPSLSGIEKTFDADEIIVTKTDLKGKITYGNRTFFKLAGYSEKECIGSQHNIIRHPEMPRCVFKLLWDTLESGSEIFAYVNNRSKNGDNYWVFAHVTPSLDRSGNVIGYHSNRRVPNKQVLSRHIVPLYKQLLDVERSSFSPKAGMEAALRVVENLLKESRAGFNQLMFSLGG